MLHLSNHYKNQGQKGASEEKGQQKEIAGANIVEVTSKMIDHAAALLRGGKLVAFPTETVYGLGVDATNDNSVAAIFVAKGRPKFNPLIAHIASPQEAPIFVEWNNISQKLAEKFWPGPLTLVLPRRQECPVSLLVSAGLDTLAVRMPAHPVALDLLRATGRPIAAPSANVFGKLSPTTAQHVAESLGNKVDLILDGGQTNIGIESTVLDLTSEKPTILRPGSVTKEQLEETLGTAIGYASENSAIKSPGMLKSHYAPNLPLRLNAFEVAENEALLAFGPDEAIKGGVMRLNLSAKGDLQEAAANLFSMLRKLDQPKFKAIAVMPVPETGIGAAINDRLRRAAASN